MLCVPQRHEDAGYSYEQALALDPLFDLARHRLSTLYTAQARKLAAAKRWEPALAVLQKLLGDHVPDGWVFDHKEAYLLRSDIYKKLNQPSRAIEDLSVVLRVDPADTHALLARGTLYRGQLQGQLAKDDFERACVSEPWSCVCGLPWLFLAVPPKQSLGPSQPATR